ncbi:MAG: S9 family peptidase, partial [Gemmatimonadaceae bacterium]
ELWIREASGESRRLTNINARWKERWIGRAELISYKSFDGKMIEASLIKPAGYVEGTRVPLAVLVHGGPTGRWRDSYENWGQLLAARGYAVLYPNIRGSTGYGQAFIESNRADWGGGDFKDVIAGVDAMVARGIADSTRLGIGGWSYGGYMSAWAITQTTRFKAAINGAGMSDLASEYGTEGSALYDKWFFGTPYENQKEFIESSPITFIKRARTPTLILQGEDDPTDPIGQAQQFYRGLKHYGVPAEFVVYPREGHGIREEQHQLDLLGRVVEWFDRWTGAYVR